MFRTKIILSAVKETIFVIKGLITKDMAGLYFISRYQYKDLLSLVFLGVFLLFFGCNGESDVVQTLYLTNSSIIDLTDKAICIDRDEFKKDYSLNHFPLLISGKDTIPSQVNDLNGDEVWDQLFFVINLAAKENKMVQLFWVSTIPEFPVKTNVRFRKRESRDKLAKPANEEILLANQVPAALGFQKYQTDGPMWENDKVAFRHYLDGRNAIDIFGKKNAEITPSNVGVDSVGVLKDNYHVMHYWGRDIFPVGNSIGLGGFALLSGNKIERLGILSKDTLSNIEKTIFKIVENGPINSVLSYDYQNWRSSSGKVYRAQEVTSIWPGIYGYKNTVKMEGLKKEDLLLVGLSNINNRKPLKEIKVGNFICLIQHDSLTYNRQWILGTAIIVPKKGYNGYMAAPKEGQLTDSYLAKLKVENGEPISYYGVAGWELSQDPNFKDSTYFTNYVTKLASQLSTEVTVEIKEN
ncbi:DUF4861 family protein [Mariniflexile sp. HMF6888]|uniref:DUF4861 family protein n=1 Tax=Mariniflexile sp. HMF6888 TaxID=3373086 RepID=UPI0037A9912A